VLIFWMKCESGSSKSSDALEKHVFEFSQNFGIVLALY